MSQLLLEFLWYLEGIRYLVLTRSFLCPWNTRKSVFLFHASPQKFRTHIKVPKFQWNVPVSQLDPNFQKHFHCFELICTIFYCMDKVKCFLKSNQIVCYWLIPSIAGRISSLPFLPVQRFHIFCIGFVVNNLTTL